MVSCSNKPLFHYYLPGLKESIMNYLLQQKSRIVPICLVAGTGETSNFKLAKDLMKVAEYNDLLFNDILFRIFTTRIFTTRN